MKNFLKARVLYVGLAFVIAAFGTRTNIPIAPFIVPLVAGAFGLMLGASAALCYFAHNERLLVGAAIAFGTFFVGGLLSENARFTGGLVVGGIGGAIAVVLWLTKDGKDLND